MFKWLIHCVFLSASTLLWKLTVLSHFFFLECSICGQNCGTVIIYLLPTALEKYNIQKMKKHIHTIYDSVLFDLGWELIICMTYMSSLHVSLQLYNSSFQDPPPITILFKHFVEQHLNRSVLKSNLSVPVDRWCCDVFR